MNNFYKYLLPLFICIGFIFSESELSDDRISKIKSLIEKSKNYAPDFKLNDSNDSLYVLSDLRGKVVLINFWATWCGPCRMEIPDFIELYDKYNDKGFEILGISLSDSKEALVNFANVYKVNYPFLYGNNKQINEITNLYGGVPAVPWSFLVGIDGEIIDTYPGAILKQYDPVTYSRLEQTIISELNKINQDSK
tara:strand:- start:997 stop:1578 length:582 start_codon:yes stop_codon:yes gene_type:complete